MTNNRIAQFLLMISVLATAGCDTKNDFDDTFKNYFIKYYGEDGKQQGVDMIVNDDGSMLLLGNSISPGDTSRVFLVKVDSEGNVKWQKQFDGINETAIDIEPALNEGEFVILSNVLHGKNALTGLNEYSVRLQIVNQDGSIQGISSIDFVTDKDEQGYAVTTVSKGYVVPGYMVAGKSSYTDIALSGTLTPPDLEDIIVLFYTETLVKKSGWEARIRNQHVGSGIKLIESETYDASRISDPTYEDRPFYLFGYSDALVGPELPSGYESNLWCNALNENGGKSDDDFTGTLELEERMSQTIKAHGSGFISVGTQTISPDQKSVILVNSQVDGFGLKFNPKIIELDVSKSLEAVSITQSLAGGQYLVLSNEKNLAGTNIWLSKVNPSANVGEGEKVEVWSASFGSITKNDFGGTVIELPDGKIVILGTVELEPQNNKMALIKLNANGEFLD